MTHPREIPQPKGPWGEVMKEYFEYLQQHPPVAGTIEFDGISIVFASKIRITEMLSGYRVQRLISKGKWGSSTYHQKFENALQCAVSLYHY